MSAATKRRTKARERSPEPKSQTISDSARERARALLADMEGPSEPPKPAKAPVNERPDAEAFERLRGMARDRRFKLVYEVLTRQRYYGSEWVEMPGSRFRLIRGGFVCELDDLEAVERFLDKWEEPTPLQRLQAAVLDGEGRSPTAEPTTSMGAYREVRP